MINFPWPPGVSHITFGFESRGEPMTSPLTGATTRAARQGGKWKATVELAMLDVDRARAWGIWHTLVQETKDTFLVNNYPFAYQKNFPNGEAGAITGDSTDITGDDATTTSDGAFDWGLPVVHGSDQRGGALIVRGLAPNSVFVAKDAIAFDNYNYREYHQLIADVTVGSNGVARFVFTPNIRIPPADGTPVLFDGQTACAARRCAAEMALDTNDSASADEANFTVTYQFAASEPLTPLTTFT